MAGLFEPHTSSANPTLNVLVRLENEGRSPYTIESTRKALTYLSKHANLNDPEQVKHFIAQHQCSNSHKKNLCLAYNRYCKYYQIQWQMPKYQTEAKRIKIPTKEKLEMIIANSGRKMATELTISFECGLRPIEVCTLKVKDTDTEQRLIYPTTAKHGLARTLKISLALQAMLADHINRHHLNPNDKLFNTTAKGFGNNYIMTRNALAKKLQDQTIKQIRLYDFRHYYATMLYARTRDILLVKQQLGHKRIENTLIYTQLLNLSEDEWTCKTASNIKDATSLIEAGFQYVTTIEGVQLFKKRK